MTEAERLAQWLETYEIHHARNRKVAALLRSQAAEIESLSTQVRREQIYANEKWNDMAAMRVEIEALKADLNTALDMLAGWCAAIDENGAGWDDWDEYYKDAAYRDGPLRGMLDVKIAAMKGETK